MKDTPNRRDDQRVIICQVGQFLDQFDEACPDWFFTAAFPLRCSTAFHHQLSSDILFTS
jgi:hypothetical protein